MRDYAPQETFPKQVNVWSNIYEMALEGVDASDTSMQERMSKELLSDREFTYGEVNFANFLPMLDFVKPIRGETFYDLGCGSGQPLMVAALAYPTLKACRGIELLEGLASLGQEVTQKLAGVSDYRAVPCAPIIVTQGDIL